MESFQNQLNTVYEKYLPKFQDALRGTGQVVSYPLLIGVADAYAKAELKIMLVGQETRGWNFEANEKNKAWTYDKSTPGLVEKLTETYKEWSKEPDLDCNEKANSVRNEKPNSPFWQFHKRLCKALKGQGNPTPAFVWSNVCRLAQGTEVSTDEATGEQKYEFGPLGENLLPRILEPSLELLWEEIAILRPHAVIMTIGWKFDPFLMQNLKTKGNAPLKNSDYEMPLENLVYKFPADAWPCPQVFQTNHPTYLQRRKKTSEVIQKLAEIIVQSMSS
jgi:hypothetical protein